MAKKMKYPGGVNELSGKKASEASKAARAAKFNNTPNIDSTLNTNAINAKKNEYGMPVGEQRFKKDKNLRSGAKFKGGVKELLKNRKMKRQLKASTKLTTDELNAPKPGVSALQKINNDPEITDLKKIEPGIKVAPTAEATKPRDPEDPKLTAALKPAVDNTSTNTKTTGKYLKFAEMSSAQQKQYRAGQASGKDFSVDGIGKYKGTSTAPPAKTTAPVSKRPASPAATGTTTTTTPAKATQDNTPSPKLNTMADLMPKGLTKRDNPDEMAFGNPKKFTSALGSDNTSTNNKQLNSLTDNRPVAKAKEQPAKTYSDSPYNADLKKARELTEARKKNPAAGRENKVNVGGLWMTKAEDKPEYKAGAKSIKKMKKC